MRPIILRSVDRYSELIQRCMSNWAVCQILKIEAFVGGNVQLAGMIIINWILRKEKI